LLGEICSAVEARYLQLKAGHIEKITSDYMNSLYLLNEWSLFKTKTGVLSGKIIGVSSSGQLEMETTEGIMLFNNKEVEFVNP
jgi:BirA family biotin operon repressor/biotin-[acetyl-CoA-carboxylase] ligase